MINVTIHRRCDNCGHESVEEVNGVKYNHDIRLYKSGWDYEIKSGEFIILCPKCKEDWNENKTADG